MKKTKKFLSLGLVVAMALSMTACGSTEPAAPSEAAPAQTSSAEKEPAKEICGENEHWGYVLDQSELVSAKKSILRVKYCEADETERLVRRMVHQAYRNGADTVLVEIPNGVTVSEDVQYGYYRLKRVDGCLWETIHAPEGKVWR
ncbi:MAG: hypothetical protein IJO55_00030 [Lachnospiraceae bacterium]|nr:hypothetical protein [Lachnospiraceae bacterium]